MTADRLSVLRVPTGDAASVAYTGTAGSIQQAVRGSSVLVWSTTDAHICVGATATTTNGTPIPAYTPIWLPLEGLTIGETPTVLVSAIQVSSGGTLFARQFI